MDDDYERIIVVKPEIFVYRLPPRTSNRAYRAAEWNLEQPVWSGRMRIVSKGNNCFIKLEDKTTGELYASCPVDAYPGTAVESVSDSARYFVIRIKDDSGRAANIGIGFVDRADSFDFNVGLQDHFKYLKQSQDAINHPILDDGKKLDLSFKEGQTIKINIGKKTETITGATSRQKPANSGGGGLSLGGGLLPPPPGSKGGISKPPTSSGATNAFQINPPSSSSQNNNNNATGSAQQPSNADLLIDIDDGFSQFLSKPATSNTSQTTSTTTTNNWVQF